MPILVCQRCGRQFKARTKRGKYCHGGCFRAAERDYSRRARQSFSPERRRAGHLVATAILRGSLVRQPCEACGTTRQVDAHHDDYSRPLDVRWLCRSHHRQHHNAQRRAAKSQSA